MKGTKMKRMPMAEALIAWTPSDWDRYPTAGQVRVGPLQRERDADWAKGFSHTAGAAFVEVRSVTGEAAKLRAFLEFHTLVVRDGIPLADAHREFLKIEEYAAGVAPELEG